MEGKNILFIFPACNTKTFGSNDGCGSHMEKTISPPLGILYLAAELSEAGYTVEACDYNAEKYSVMSLQNYISRADLVGISMLSFNREHAFEIIKKINELRPDLPVIAGGPDCILHPRAIPGTKLTVCQEAEHIIVQIVDAVLNNSDLSKLPGVVFQNSLGMIICGKVYEQNNNLDRYKFPRRDLLRDNKGYSVIGKKASRDITTMITSRGCPKHCVFCAHSAIAFWKYRMRSVQNVLDEIKEIAEQGYKIVGIADDNFTANKKRAMAIMQGICEMKPGISFVVQGRVDAADFELYSLMKKAGVKGITFGLESGNQEVLDFYDKETTVEQNRKAVTLADKAGLYTAGLFILGAPMEKKDHFHNTYKFAISLPLDITSFWVLDYTFGSALWQNEHEKGVIAENEFNVPAGKERGTSPYYTKEIEQIAESYFFKFYKRRSYWVRQIGKLFRTREQYFLKVLIVGVFWLARKKVSLMVGSLKKDKLEPSSNIRNLSINGNLY